jgi:hypothetical protein
MSVQQTKKRRIFLSYGHDRYAAFADGLKQKLKHRSHEVWFDAERLKPGKDWELYIEQGLAWAAEPGGEGCVVLLMTPHSVRRPDGYCLNELARATSKKIPIIPVMLAACEPPLSIARIQWLDPSHSTPGSNGCWTHWSTTTSISRARSPGLIRGFHPRISLAISTTG